MAGVVYSSRKLGGMKGLWEMDDRQQRQINEAAQRFAEAIAESYQAVAERSVSAQQLNAELTQAFFNSVIENLQAQAEGDKAMTEDLVEGQRRQREAAQALAQGSIGSYMEFLNSMFSYYQDNLKQAQRGTWP